MDSHDQHQHQHHDHAAAESDQTALAELIDLDAEVLHAYLTELTAWIRGLAADATVRRILDVGAGTGTGTFALLERFEHAEATALDISGQLLRQIGRAHV